MDPYMPLPLPLPPPMQNAIPAQNQSLKQRCTDFAKGTKIRTIVISTIAFAILSHLTAYRIAEGINSTVTGDSYGVLSEYGQPTLRGSLIMSGVFLAIMIYLTA